MIDNAVNFDIIVKIVVAKEEANDVTDRFLLLDKAQRAHNHHFSHYAPETLPYAVDRYINETNRLYGVLNKQLAGNHYIATEYSIADIACYPWIKPYERQRQNLNEFPHLKAWFMRMTNRPAVKRAYAKAGLVNAGAALTQQDKSILFG
jgi:GSH-dependent disulfide-bond oxidoreductase